MRFNIKYLKKVKNKNNNAYRYYDSSNRILVGETDKFLFYHVYWGDKQIGSYIYEIADKHLEFVKEVSFTGISYLNLDKIDFLCLWREEEL